MDDTKEDEANGKPGMRNTLVAAAAAASSKIPSLSAGTSPTP